MSKRYLKTRWFFCPLLYHCLLSITGLKLRERSITYQWIKKSWHMSPSFAMFNYLLPECTVSILKSIHDIRDNPDQIFYLFNSNITAVNCLGAIKMSIKLSGNNLSGTLRKLKCYLTSMSWFFHVFNRHWTISYGLVKTLGGKTLFVFVMCTL